MAAVLLVDDPDDIGVLLGIAVGDGAGVVPGAVVHQDDFHLVASLQEGVDAVLHVVLRVVAGDRECQKFHKNRSYDLVRRLSQSSRARPAMASML